MCHLIIFVAFWCKCQKSKRLRFAIWFESFRYYAVIQISWKLLIKIQLIDISDENLYSIWNHFDRNMKQNNSIRFDLISNHLQVSKELKWYIQSNSHLVFLNPFLYFNDNYWKYQTWKCYFVLACGEMQGFHYEYQFVNWVRWVAIQSVNCKKRCGWGFLQSTKKTHNSLFKLPNSSEINELHCNLTHISLSSLLFQNVSICSFIIILIHTKSVNHAKDLCI